MAKGMEDDRPCTRCGEIGRPVKSSWCRACSREYGRDYYRKNHHKWYAKTLEQYGLTLEQYESMCIAQGNVCGICGCTSKQRLNVDHDHDTGKVRGLLCYDCNRGIGLLRTAANLRRASDYMEEADINV